MSTEVLNETDHHQWPSIFRPRINLSVQFWTFYLSQMKSLTFYDKTHWILAKKFLVSLYQSSMPKLLFRMSEEKNASVRALLDSYLALQTKKNHQAKVTRKCWSWWAYLWQDLLVSLRVAVGAFERGRVRWKGRVLKTLTAPLCLRSHWLECRCPRTV